MIVGRTRVQLERELQRSIEKERKLRAELAALERDAVAVRESKSTLTSEHAERLMSTRTALTLACRTSTLIRERLLTVRA